MHRSSFYHVTKRYFRRFRILRRFKRYLYPFYLSWFGKGREVDYWGRRHLDDAYWQGGIHWGQIPQIADYINESVSGDPKIDYLQYAHKKYLAPLRKKKGGLRMLSLCCGTGELERQLIRAEIVDYIDAFDASAACIDKALAEAKKENIDHVIKFYCQDLNRFVPFDGVQYQVILNESALHHIENLEDLMAGLHDILEDDGIFICHDYIGPNKHQWTDRQLKVINDVLARFPDELKRSRTDPGLVHQHKHRLTLAEMNAIDSTEGVRSEDIISVFTMYFDLVEKKDFGGTILHVLLNDIAGNFCKEQYGPLVDTLINLEKYLILAGYLNSDFSFFVGKKH